MNKVFLIGRTTADIELKKANNGYSVCQFSLAVQRKATHGEKLVDFINITCWDKTAENVAKYVKKGHQLAVEGELQINVFEKDGKKIFNAFVLCSSVEFLQNKEQQQTQQVQQNNNYQQAPQQKTQTQYNQQFVNNFEVTNDDLPF